MTRTPAAWLRILAGHELHDCLLEFKADDTVEGGPLAKIWENGTHLYLVLAWFARFRPEEGQWRYVGSTKWTVEMASVEPLITTDGCITFTIPFFGDFTIYPQHVRQLDVRQVNGLPQNLEGLVDPGNVSS